MFWELVGAGAGVVLLVIGVFVWMARREIRHLREMSTGFIEVQRAAMKNIQERNFLSSAIAPPTSEELEQQFRRTCRGFQFAYTVEREGYQYVHHVSGQARGKSERFLTQCTLLLMAELVHQFQEAGFGDKVKFNVGASDTGTHHVEFLLNASQQKALQAVVDRLATLVAPNA